jgi:uncharacterized protein YcbK (DUF882 family)
MEYSFINPTYAPQMPTYISPPIAAMEKTLAEQEQKYFESFDATTNLLSGLKTLKVDSKDEHFRQEAVDKLDQIINVANQRGDWENMGLVVRQAARDVATNTPLILATEAYKDKRAKLDALKARIGKKPEDGGITETDFLYEYAQTEKNDQGIVYDPNLKTWKSTYKVNEVPAYYDESELANKFIEGWKENATVGNITKGENGKFYRTMSVTEDGITSYAITTKEATFEEIYNAARTHVTQNQNVGARRSYEENRDAPSFETFEKQGINRDAMITQLQRLKIPGISNISSMNNDELTKLYYNELKTFKNISGAVEKYAFMQEDLKVIGQTALGMRVHAAASNPELLEKVNAIQYLTDAVKVTGLPDSITKYNELIASYDPLISEHTASIRTLSNEIVDLNKQLKEGTGNKEDIKLKVENRKNQIARSQSAIDTAVVERDRHMQQLAKFQADAANELGLSSTPAIQAIDKLLKYKETSNYKVILEQVTKNSPVKSAPTDRPLYSFESPYRDIKDSYKIGLNKLVKDGIVTKDQADEFETAMETERSLTDVSNKYVNLVQDKIKNSAEKTIQFGYIYLATKTNGKPTDFAQFMTRSYRDNFDAFTIIQKDTGEAMQISALKGDLVVNPENVEIVGVTTEYIPGHGYALVATETMKDKDGKVSGKRQLLLKSNDPGTWRDMAVRELRTTDALQKSQIKEGYGADGVSTFEQIWSLMEIDPQLAVFNNMPIEKPTNGKEYVTDTRSINVSNEYGANVTRKVNQAGIVTWSVTAFNKNTREYDTKEYPTKEKVEFALEKLAGTGYKVPMSELTPVTAYPLTNGTFKDPNGSGGSMATYLHPLFYDQLKKFDAEVGQKYVITDMLRSMAMNKNLQSAGKDAANNSYHMYGGGVDIRFDPQLKAKLESMSYEIPGSKFRALTAGNLKYFTHGPDPHIHMEFFNPPAEYLQWVEIMGEEYK